MTSERPTPPKEPPTLDNPSNLSQVREFIGSHSGTAVAAFTQGDEYAEETFANVDVSNGGNRAILQYDDGRQVTVDVEQGLEWMAIK